MTSMTPAALAIQSKIDAQKESIRFSRAKLAALRKGDRQKAQRINLSISYAQGTLAILASKLENEMEMM